MSVSYVGDLVRLRPEEGRAMVLEAYRRAGTIVGAADILGVHEKHLFRLVRQHGIRAGIEAERAQRARFFGAPEAFGPRGG